MTDYYFKYFKYFIINFEFKYIIKVNKKNYIQYNNNNNIYKKNKSF
jgi:hypothetical protein